MSISLLILLLVVSEDEDTEEDGASGGLSMEAAGADSGDTYPCTYCGIAFVTHHELKVLFWEYSVILVL